MQALAAQEYVYGHLGVGDAIVGTVGAEECGPIKRHCYAVLCAVGEDPERRRQKEETGADSRPGSLGCGNVCSARDVQRSGPSTAEPAHAPLQHHK